MEQPVPLTITVRPSKELRPFLLKLAKDLDKSEGQILLESAAAILAMIESGEDHVPAMVRAIRVLREHNATFSEPTKVIGRQLLRDKREVSLYSEISAGHPSAVCADAPVEKIRLPADLVGHADFAVVVRGDSMEPMVSDGEVAVFRAAQTAGNGARAKAAPGWKASTPPTRRFPGTRMPASRACSKAGSTRHSEPENLGLSLWGAGDLKKRV